MSRFNIFSRVHKALSAMLYDTALTLEQASFTNKDEAEPSLKKLVQLLDVFDKHAENDDNYILPAIIYYEPALVDFFEKIHAQDHDLANQMRKQVSSYRMALSGTRREQIGMEITRTFTEFMHFNLAQMANEELVLNNVLWKYYSDMELMVINQRTFTAIPAEEASSSTWVVRGLSNADIVGLLRAVKDNAPDSVFNSLFAITEKELPGIRFHQVMESLTYDKMIA